ncbi:tRNA (uracil-5-)-methyltransferase [Micractinium conductrix]|uniref:tRNA (Uracil-5-)-methyltransferase n=1 Tax=Micractinium conductrix TaxID=554055 RepID=A0A2P6VF49_9CHLO|nr:tRNA (uracil-5-)-methyltransferase [Micractinium conductrix]|eukprot:PSC72701.1 tRNA (uracil-5-)-methyltransferase [Micractinium conductrix]
MTRTAAQGRRKAPEAADGGAAAAEEVPAAASAPTFSPALTTIDPSQYDAQLEAKVARITTQFARFSPPPLHAYRSAPSHYRMRAEFRVWHDGDDLFYLMFERDEETGKNRDVRVDSFPVASELLNELMGLLREHVKARPILRHKLFQANFHTTLSGDAMVSLIYHKKLNDEWKEAAQQLRDVLATAPSSRTKPQVIGRSRGQKVNMDKDEVLERLQVDGQTLQQVQVEASFSQPNAGMCQNMLSWARSCTEGSTDRDLLELYCGNGNFTQALAPNFRKVVATEVSKSSVAAAKRNFELNGVSNVFVARMASEEFTGAWHEKRPMKRLEGLDLAALSFSTLLVDPPRAGLDAATVKLLREFDSIVYVSCNPDTLHANLLEVKDEYEIKRFALFDQFPYTHHVECGVYLQRRQQAAAGAGGAAAAEAAAGGQAAAQPAAEQQEQQQQQEQADDGQEARGAKRKAEEV